MYQLKHLLSPELESCYICETVPTACCNSSPSAPRLQHHTHEELASIRIVLRKLTSLRVANEEDAEDLVQETLLTMTEKYHEGELKRNLLVWSMGILRKKVGNYYRKAQRYSATDNSLVRAGRARCGDWTTHSPESRLRHKELHALIQRLIAESPLPERRVLELRLAGLATREIVLRLRPERYQNVINRLYRGRRRLARELVQYGYADLE